MIETTIGNIESPCIRNCCLDQDDICMGCYRTVSEIIAWGTANNEERKTILLNAKRREKEAVGKLGWSRN